ncbi:hypothetical protein OA437_03380 [Candidatus Pelagibacter sp.]|nr:hypothetical protein [Candidatus Pelagibacter sp.]
MKIFDCFMYFDEEILLDLRMNILDKYVDYFVIVESTFTHKGEERKLHFNHKRFEKFENKIIYLVYDEKPKDIKEILKNDIEPDISNKFIINALLRENGQRNFIINGLKDADDDDYILVSDVDEIPNLEEVDFSKINQKILLFRQDMFYYKFNLNLPNFSWTGTKGCKKRNFISPQWLRNIKDRKYNFLRFDTFFSKTKYMNIKIIDNGGWHFTNLKNAKEIEYKLKSYLHHREFDVNPISSDEIKKIMNDKIAIYDLSLDKTTQKIGHGKKLQKYSLEKLPKFLQNNIVNYQEWID